MDIHPTTPVIVAARRTAIARAGGAFRTVTVEKLAAPVLRAVLSDAALEPGQVDDVILGNAAGPGGNPARVALLEAGLPVSVPGLTVDRQCGSGLEAIIQAAHKISAGAADCLIAGGVESASTAPSRITSPNHPTEPGKPYARARFAPDEIGDPDMGIAAENVAERYGITRERQDKFALQSHQKACTSQQGGFFQREIVTLEAAEGLVDEDACIRCDASLEALSDLTPVFKPNGSVTAGNACPVNDGAAAVLVVSGKVWRDVGAPPGLVMTGAETGAVDPNVLGLGPVPAARRLEDRYGISVHDADLIEFNEAFAAQVLGCVDDLALDPDRLNIGGGALAIGHPYGASGAILVTRLFSEMLFGRAKTARMGLAMIGIGGGQGLAAAFRPVRDT